ncbi:putative RNA recognition motif domain, nucleotide-binding alpha-beta plait domain superfamily [Helianthus annuus]|nr:putative RNA recognition motif domain, nucleotide-binding alpha-beta plait domain superfamily [Helianthus annuus]
MDGGDVGGNWNTVVNKKKSRSEGVNGKSMERSSKGVVTKFFISNLPRGCNPWDLADFVKVFGEVSGVYIARKLDKEGRRFGFVSFSNVAEVKDMERALNGIKMGDCKLVANLARFAKENMGQAVRKVGGSVAGKKNPSFHTQINKTRIQTSVNNGKGKLFSELFKEGQGIEENRIPSVEEPGLTIELADETMAFKELIGKALVGRCKDLKLLRNLNSILAEHGVTGVSLSYLGGLAMLLNFDKEECCVNFLLDNLVWKEWFSNLDPWEGQSLPFERLAWVKIQGVPIHLADNDVLNNIAEHYGKVVHGSQMEAKDENLSVSWIGLLVGEGGRIQECLSLKCKNKLFRVWLEEEITDWTPDSVGPVRPVGDIGFNQAEYGASSASSSSGTRRLANNNSDDGPLISPQVSQNEVDARVGVEVGNVNVCMGMDKSGDSNHEVGKGLMCDVHHEVEEQVSNSGGVQVQKQQSNVFFFHSVDTDSRPKKRTFKYKPRNLARTSSVLSCSSSGGYRLPQRLFHSGLA